MAQLDAELLQVLGDQRIRLIDVGARSGISERWRRFAALLDAIAFEPDTEECARLNSTNTGASYPMTFLPFALGAVDGETAQLNICRQPGCSSLLTPNRALTSVYPYDRNMEVVRTHPLTLHRLDTLLSSRQLPGPDVLKIDTQGSELAILRGASTLLKKVLIIELEIEFAEQYVGQPMFGELDSFMRSFGFTLRGLRRTLWRRKVPANGWPRSPRGGQLIHGDALYVNDDLIGCRGHFSSIETLKFLIGLAAYQQDDLCLALLSRPHPALAHMSESERKQIAYILVADRSTLLNRIVATLLAIRSHREIRRWVDSKRTVSATDWHDPDFY